MTALANMHSVKNRFLLRINNQSARRRFADASSRRWRATSSSLGACLTIERSSLPAFGWLWRNRRRLWAKRGRSRRRCKQPGGEAAPSAATAIAFRPMRIGILGTRGIPARYGGFETLAEELSARPGRARPRRDRLHARRATPSRALDAPRREDPRAADDSDEVPRHGRARRALRRGRGASSASTPCWSATRSTRPSASAAPLAAGRASCSERRRPRAPPPQVERRWAARVPDLGAALDDRSRRRRDRTRR